MRALDIPAFSRIPWWWPSVGAVMGNGAAPSTNRLVDENGNVLTDENGNALIFGT